MSQNESRSRVAQQLLAELNEIGVDKGFAFGCPSRFGGRVFTKEENEVILDLLCSLASAPSETAITDNDRRWRFLEHGCQWVSWTPINGNTVSFDPRNVTGYTGDLNDMRGQADIEIRKQLNTLREGAEKFRAKRTERESKA